MVGYGCLLLDGPMGRMAGRSIVWIEICGAEYVLTDLGVIRDWFWGTEHGKRTVCSGWDLVKYLIELAGYGRMEENEDSNMERTNGLADNRASRQKTCGMHEYQSRHFVTPKRNKLLFLRQKLNLGFILKGAGATEALKNQARTLCLPIFGNLVVDILDLTHAVSSAGDVMYPVESSIT
ncbi:hypothetical protein Bca52824_019047 [Brassica carinata]|uniref:Uncharacterized protein n=1 Tax=Brassica carinata TaxID=52824 RepID=A0A8X8AY47_BRACI|nr:hypothetical protein Bca52824_019047 [Brassica carinata]